MKAQDKQKMLGGNPRKCISYFVRIFLGVLVFCSISSVDADATSSNSGDSELAALKNDLADARGYNGKSNKDRMRGNGAASNQQNSANGGEVGIDGFVQWAKDLWKIVWDGVRYGAWYWKIIPVALIWMVYSKIRS